MKKIRSTMRKQIKKHRKKMKYQVDNSVNFFVEEHQNNKIFKEVE